MSIEKLKLELSEIISARNPYAPLGVLRHSLREAMQDGVVQISAAERLLLAEWVVAVCEAQGCALFTTGELAFWWDPPEFFIPLPGPAPLPEGWPR